MKKMFLLLGLCTVLVVNAQQTNKPKLIIGIVVDQMRYDYLEKFSPKFGKDGFNKLMREGFSLQNLHYNYKPTYTGPGHASIFTGTTPSIHGIVGNNWYSKAEGRSVYCAKEYFADGTEEVNPKRMKSESFADGMKQFFNFQSKSFGVSLKDRGAVLPAGHLADGAYWFDSKSGKWISSAYYKERNPDWLATFNRQDFAKKYLSENWELSLKQGDYALSFPDDNDYESHYDNDKKPVFPYNLMELYKKRGDRLFKEIPQGNRMTADLAKHIIQSENLGKDEVPDFLSISFSATDYVGHRFGVQSMEVFDTYVKLDKTLADLISFLEREIGKESFLLFLTSDHGAGMPLSYLKANKLPHGRVNKAAIRKELDQSLDSVFGPQQWITSLINLNIYFNDSLKNAMGEKFEKVEAFTINWLANRPEFVAAYSSSSIMKLKNKLGQMVANGVLEKESGDIIAIESPNWSDYSLTGSTHGSPYQYDTHVPALFYGFNVKKGESNRNYSITSIVTTVAKLSGIPFQNTSEKQVVIELLK